MTEHRRRFDPAELRDPVDAVDEAEVARAYAVARLVETTLSGADPAVGGDLADRIMAAIAQEPPPRTAGILTALRRRPGLRGLADSIGIAWRRALGARSPFRARAMGFGYLAAVLVVGVSLSGVAAYGAAGVWHVIAPDGTRQPDATQVIGTPAPLASPEAGESLEPGETVEPSESAEPSETPSLHPGQTEDGGEQGTASQTASGDDHGGTGTPSPTSTSEEHGGGGATATPSATPKETPQPTGSPKATASN